MERYILFTAGKGPAECNLALELALDKFKKEAFKFGIHIEIVSSENDGKLLSSLQLKLSGNHLDILLSKWLGTILWIQKSPFRKTHKRKNWYIAVFELSKPLQVFIDENHIRFETMRSSGPGGQHVNKTSTAVRATHIPTGLTVQVMDTRSQLQNKKITIDRIKEKIHFSSNNQNLQIEKDKWTNKTEIERGNPIRTFTGENFTELAK